MDLLFLKDLHLHRRLSCQFTLHLLLVHTFTQGQKTASSPFKKKAKNFQKSFLNAGALISPFGRSALIQGDGNQAPGASIEASLFCPSLPSQRSWMFHKKIKGNNSEGVWPNSTGSGVICVPPSLMWELWLLLELLFGGACLHPRVLTILSHKVLPTWAAI